MFIRLRTMILAVVVLLCTAGVSYAGCDGPNYPAGYPFGQPGTPAHPNGHDGYPGGHADNPVAPHGGPGGKGVGSGKGGCGGDGANGGSGGTGGESGPNGGCGGAGGDGGANPGGTGGSGGTGGVGVDCGGAGGGGGSGTHGGAGGCGGNATGPGSDGGAGGNGGAATDGIGGNGGCGGGAAGTGGCGGKGGDGGNVTDNNTGNTTAPGMPGFPGQGDPTGGPDGDPCDGAWGTVGRRIVTVLGGFEIMPIKLAFNIAFLAITTIADDDTAGISALKRGWPDRAGSEIGLGTRQIPPYVFDTDGIETYKCLLHPNSLLGDTIRITLEARVIGNAPILQIDFGVNEEFATIPSVPLPIADGWMSYQFTIVRPVAGEPMGKHLDMFAYSGRDIEVRMFEAHDLGKKGDVNLDNVVDLLDAAIVLENYSLTGDTNIEDGDTNLDGTVDTADVLNILEAIED